MREDQGDQGRHGRVQCSKEGRGDHTLYMHATTSPSPPEWDVEGPRRAPGEAGSNQKQGFLQRGERCAGHRAQQDGERALPEQGAPSLPRPTVPCRTTSPSRARAPVLCPSPHCACGVPNPECAIDSARPCAPVVCPLLSAPCAFQVSWYGPGRECAPLSLMFIPLPCSLSLTHSLE